MASLPRRNVPPPMSTTASGSNNAVMPATSPAFSLATNNRSKSWGSLADSLVVKSFIVTLYLEARIRVSRSHQTFPLHHRPACRRQASEAVETQGFEAYRLEVSRLCQI